MKILINYQSDAEYATGKIYAKCLIKLGHDVYTFSDVLEMYRILCNYKLPFITKIANWRLQIKHQWKLLQEIPVILMEPLLKKVEIEINRRLISIYKKVLPDVFLVFKGKLIRPEALKAVRDINGCKLLYYNGDDHFNLK